MVDFEKVVFVLKDIYQKDLSGKYLFEIVNSSEFEFEEYTEVLFRSYYPAYRVKLKAEHDVYIRNYKQIEVLSNVIKKDLESLLPLSVEEIKIVPDYDKLKIINFQIEPVYTDWEIINRAQRELIEQLKKTSTPLEIKNIGNSSRTILKDLANIVFKKEKYNPKESNIELTSDKYKNQLHTYIKEELAGEKQTELRGFAEAAINLVEKSIILANALTHRNESQKQVAELCVIGTITVINIVTFIEKR